MGKAESVSRSDSSMEDALVKTVVSDNRKPPMPLSEMSISDPLRVRIFPLEVTGEESN